MSRQSLYFQQIFKILELWGFEQAKQAHHLGYEMVVLPEGVISSRKGNAPVYDDVRDAVLARARRDHRREEPGDAGRGTRSDGGEAGGDRLAQVRDAGARQQQDRHLRHRGGALLRWSRGALHPVCACAGLPDPREQRRTERMRPRRLDFGGAAAGGAEPAAVDRALPDEVQRAAAEYRPLLIASYVYELAKAFNDFYHACPVLQSEEPVRSARLALVDATRQALANGLALLGIEAPSVM